MAKLLIDVGNTTTKAVIYSADNFIEVLRVDTLTIEHIAQLEKQFDISYVLLTAVGTVPQNVLEYLRTSYLESFFEFSSTTPVGIDNLYATPNTLGCDRLLAAVAVAEEYPNQNVLVIDMGSAITVDFVNDKGQYCGGNISVGVGLRFKALNQYTSRLPLLSVCDDVCLCGTTTTEAIEYGVINGIIFELKAYIKKYSEKYPNLKIVLTGGDSEYFSKTLDCELAVDVNLVFKGLNIVFIYNAEK